ncbi:MAG TPA: 50S ribosomal protein L11 methyltransferase [Bacteroidales bacterium]|nr:50S ribosomal protein L11 methyltransferase [Bacteroidales bacterium]
MTYLEITFACPVREELDEILTARLSELGFDSFLTEETSVKAYIEQHLFDNPALNELLSEPFFEGVVVESIETLADKNWNALWESNYQPVIINDLCRVRAPFHEPDPAFKFELLIEPRMSFGTAHHETTSQMIAMMLNMDFIGKDVLDMGSGTAILAILAKKSGANVVWAIDNDEWAYNNAIDNIRLNDTPDVKVLLGDASTIGTMKFDVVIANINRNILLEDMHHYADALKAGSVLLMSGFYESDLQMITDKATSLGLTEIEHTAKNMWVAASYKKK